MKIKKRVQKELDKLTIKIQSLKEFIVSDASDNIGDVQTVLLQAQLKTMESYAHILQLRINHLEINEPIQLVGPLNV